MKEHPKRDDIGSTLGLDDESGRRRAVWRWTAAVVVVSLLGGLATWYLSAGRDNGEAGYVTAPLVRRDLVVNVTATGTLQPTNEVEVSSDLSGMIEQVFVDNNEEVEEGEVLATLDR